jgi:hypothetical protein
LRRRNRKTKYCAVTEIRYLWKFPRYFALDTLPDPRNTFRITIAFHNKSSQLISSDPFSCSSPPFLNHSRPVESFRSKATMGCFPSRVPQQYHPCILVGSVVNGKPVPDFNRRPIAFRIDTGDVEDGSTPEVRAGRGSIKRVEFLGRVKVQEE